MRSAVWSQCNSSVMPQCNSSVMPLRLQRGRLQATSPERIAIRRIKRTNHHAIGSWLVSSIETEKQASIP